MNSDFTIDELVSIAAKGLSCSPFYKAWFKHPCEIYPYVDKDNQLIVLINTARDYYPHEDDEGYRQRSEIFRNLFNFLDFGTTLH